jgi:hypothetical protein
MENGGDKGLGTSEDPISGGDMEFIDLDLHAQFTHPKQQRFFAIDDIAQPFSSDLLNPDLHLRHAT